MAKRSRGGSTIALAQEHYREKVPMMPGNYAGRMGSFFGQDVSGAPPVVHYRQKITSGVDGKYANNLKAAFGIGSKQ